MIEKGRSAVKCLIIDEVHEIIADELSKYMQIQTELHPTHEELKALIGDVDVLIMRVDPKIDAEILDAAPNLKVIGVCSVGLNHIDTGYAKQKGIEVFNAPGMNGNAVAELTISKMLDISRGTIEADHEVKDLKRWNKYDFVGRELRGRTLGILGFGHVGQRVSEIAHVLGMNIVAYDPYQPTSAFELKNATPMGIQEVCEKSDFISIHMPLTDETRNMFNAELLSHMKPDAVLINMSRGGIVNEQDMYEALTAGKIGGYATDVMNEELSGTGTQDGSVRVDSPLFQCKNFIVSPHIGAQTVDASRDIGQYILGKIKPALQLS